MIRNLGQVAAIYIGSSAPRNTNLIWLDNTVVPFVFRAYDGSAWSEIATHKWVRAYVDGWLVTLPPRQLADDGDYMLINSNNVNYKITVKDFVKSAVGNPLDFKGIIRVSADFPNPSTLEAGDMYVIITSPVGGAVTDPYSGKTFEDSEKIVWDEVTRSWESLGKLNITVNLTTSYSETEVTIHSSAGKETTIQGATDQLAGVMLPGQYLWLQALSNGSIVPGDPSPLTPLTPAHKHNYNDIINRLVSQQGTGESTIDPMSQKATTDALNLKFDKASVLQVSGAATDKVMSQKAVTDALKTLSDDFNNKLTNYLPLAGGTMKGNIRFPIGNGIVCNDVAGTAAYVVLRTWNANNSTRMYVGTVNFPTYISSTASDLIHDRNGSSYLLWDSFNLKNPATLSGNNTFTGNNTFQAGKFNVGPVKVTSSGSLLSNINSPAGSAWSRNLVFRANNDITSSIVFGGYNSIDDTSIGYAHIGIGDVTYSTAQYKFYSDRLEVPRIWRLTAESKNILNVNLENNFISLGSNSSTSYIISNNYDLKHRRFTTTSAYLDHIIWDSYNLPTPASTTDLANYLPLIGGTLTGQLTIKQEADIKLRLQSTDADNHCIIQAINAQASQLGVFGYAGDKWVIGHNGTYYEIWDKYNLTNPVTYTTDTYNYATLRNKDGQYFTYIKAGTSGLLPHSQATLANGGAGLLGTSDWGFNAAYINNLHTNKISFGTNGSFIDNQSGNSDHIGIGFYTSQNAACPVYVGSLCVSDSYAYGAPNIPANGIYSKGIIYIENGIGFRNSIWTNDLTPNRNYSGYLQVLDAYDAANAGGPNNHGTVLQVNSRNAHWANQLWFSGGAEARKNGLYYRHMAYNETTYGEWNRLLTNKDVNILSASYNNNPNSLPTNQIFYAETQGVAGTPTPNGLLFSVQGNDEGIQLWAGANRTELYYRTKWISFGKWIKLATTSDLGNYLPLTGGTLSGNLTINTVGSTTLVINNNDTNGSETFMRVLRKGTASAAIGFRDSLGAYIYNYNSNKYLFIDNDGDARVGTINGSTKLALITDIPTVSGYLPLSGGTLTGALTMNSGKNNAVIDVVRGTGSNWNEGTGALSVQVPSDNGQTPLILARRSGATINTATLSERLLDMELLDTGTIFRVGMSGVNALELNVTSFTNKVGIGKLFGKRIATIDQIPSIPSISISNSGSGNAVTAISASRHTLTVTKGATYLTSSSLDGYATQSWANGQFASLSLYNTTGSYTTIRTRGNEFCLGNTIATSASNEVIVNYRIPSGCTYAPSTWVWRAGSSTSYANGYWGSLYMNGDLVATQTWVNNKGYLTSHQTIYNLTFQAGTFSAKTFDPNGAAATVNIPTNTSHLTNDSGFITSSALNGYATQAWVNSQNFVKSTSTKKVTDIQPVDALPATQASGVLYLVFG